MIVSKASFSSEGLETKDKLPPSRTLEAGAPGRGDAGQHLDTRVGIRIT